MAKYRGKHQGKIRGHYIKKGLLYIANSNEEAHTVERKVHNYLSDMGHCLDVEHYSDHEFPHHICFYHFGGASIGMYVNLSNKKDVKITNSQIESLYFKKLPYYIRLLLISNDSLDDVIYKIIGNFPDFKKLDPKII